MPYKTVLGLVIIYCIVFYSCNNREITMEFSIPDKTYAPLDYKIFSNDKFEILANDSLYDYGFAKFYEDSLFLTSNSTLYTNQKTYNFILKKDSICEIKMMYLKKNPAINNHDSFINGISNFENKDLGCYSFNSSSAIK